MQAQLTELTPSNGRGVPGCTLCSGSSLVDLTLAIIYKSFCSGGRKLSRLKLYSSSFSGSAPKSPCVYYATLQSHLHLLILCLRKSLDQPLCPNRKGMKFWFNECISFYYSVDFLSVHLCERWETNFSSVFDTVQRLDLISAGASGLV